MDVLHPALEPLPGLELGRQGPALIRLRLAGGHGPFQFLHLVAKAQGALQPVRQLLDRGLGLGAQPLLGCKGPKGQLGAVEPLDPAFQLGHPLALPAFLRGQDLHRLHGLQGR